VADTSRLLDANTSEFEIRDKGTFYNFLKAYCGVYKEKQNLETSSVFRYCVKPVSTYYSVIPPASKTAGAS
jgi:hypothetical protein